MTHVILEKRKLLARVRRIKGQIEAIERAIEADSPCERTIQTIASARGALMGLMGELIEEHLTSHVQEASRKPTPSQVKASKDIVDMIKAYLK